jgi:cobaltochelatase CobS
MRTVKYDIPEVEDIPDIVKIIDDLIVGNNVFLVGSAGTGKSTLAEIVSYALFGRQRNDSKTPPYIVINCNQWTSPIDLKGGQTIEGYKEGGLIEAWRDGKILILDEMPKLDANTAGILNAALAKSADEDAIIFNGLNNPIKKHPHFGCIATGNVTGKGASGNYVGNNKQDASLIDRFSSCIYHIGFNTKLERKVVYPTVVEICIKIRDAILRYEGKEQSNDDTEDIMTLRTMINLQRGYELEMKRLIGAKNEEGNIISKVRHGKTLKDGLESYFFVMGTDKAKKIKEDVNIEGFYGSYLGGENRELFIKEFNRRKG